MSYTATYTPTYTADTSGTVTVTPSAARGVGTANGGTVQAGDGVVGPTIIGSAGQAAASGSAFPARTSVVVRAGVATGHGSASGSRVEVLGAYRRVHAGTPRVLVSFRAELVRAL